MFFIDIGNNPRFPLSGFRFGGPMRFRLRDAALPALLLGTLLLGARPRPAEACMHGMSRQVDPVPMGVAEAEVLLDQGKPRAAIARLRAVDASLARRKPGASPVSDQALRVFARAVARTGGDTRIDFEGEVEGEGAEGKRIDWAEQMMRELVKAQPNDPGVATDLGEVLAQVPAKRDEAEKLLTKQETGDLMSTAHAYAALARARSSRAADGPGFLRGALSTLDHGRLAIDLSRCRNMTKDQAACTLADPREISKAEPKPPVFAAPKQAVSHRTIRI
jgi:hypothetical protein